MERLGILSVAACAACLMAGAADLHASKGRLVLAARGQSPLCAIETAGSARPNVRYAAEELRDHVKMITGVKLDIVEEGRKTIAGGVRVSVGFDGHRVEDYLPERIKEYNDKLTALGIKKPYES